MRTLFFTLVILLTSYVSSIVEIQFGDNGEWSATMRPSQLSEDRGQPAVSWNAREAREEDIPFFQGLFANAEIMKFFGDGNPRDKESTKTRLSNSWLPRTQLGQPHGAMIILNDSNEQIGYIVMGAGDDPGVSEIAYALMPKYWGKGIMSSVLHEVTHGLAPMVNNLGNLAKALQEQRALTGEQQELFETCNAQKMKPSDFISAFSGEVLKQVVMTSSLENVGSWRAAEKAGFKSIDLPEECFTLTYEGTLSKTEENLEEAVREVLRQQQVDAGDEASLGGHFCLKTGNGDYTVSIHERFNKLKAHFSYDIS